VIIIFKLFPSSAFLYRTFLHKMAQTDRHNSRQSRLKNWHPKTCVLEFLRLCRGSGGYINYSTHNHCLNTSFLFCTTKWPLKFRSFFRCTYKSVISLAVYFVQLQYISGPGVDSASNRNEYQVYFLGVKAAGA